MLADKTTKHVGDASEVRRFKRLVKEAGAPSDPDKIIDDILSGRGSKQRAAVAELAAMMAARPGVAAVLERYGFGGESAAAKLGAAVKLVELYDSLSVNGGGWARGGTHIPTSVMYDLDLLDRVLAAEHRGDTSLPALLFRYSEQKYGGTISGVPKSASRDGLIFGFNNNPLNNILNFFLTIFYLPTTILNYAGLIVSVIWLLVSGNFPDLISGVAIGLFGFGWILFALLPSRFLQIPAAQLDHRDVSLRVVLLVCSVFWTYSLMAAWCVFVFVSMLALGHGNNIPIVLWAYVVAITPWSRLAAPEAAEFRRTGQFSASIIALMAGQIACQAMMVGVLFFHATVAIFAAAPLCVGALINVAMVVRMSRKLQTAAATQTLGAALT
jgi:hypothetical protein